VKIFHANDMASVCDEKNSVAFINVASLDDLVVILPQQPI
jgi:hypothetical protein